jgi:hypothetical protein
VLSFLKLVLGVRDVSTMMVFGANKNENTNVK